MDPAGAERLRGFRAPGADVAAGSASSPAQGQSERSGSAQTPIRRRSCHPTGPGWRWAVSAAGVLVVAMVVIAALAFKLGSGSATSANRASATATRPRRRRRPRCRSPTCTDRSFRRWC